MIQCASEHLTDMSEHLSNSKLTKSPLRKETSVSSSKATHGHSEERSTAAPLKGILRSKQHGQDGISSASYDENPMRGSSSGDVGEFASGALDDGAKLPLKGILRSKQHGQDGIPSTSYDENPIRDSSSGDVGEFVSGAPAGGAKVPLKGILRSKQHGQDAYPPGEDPPSPSANRTVGSSMGSLRVRLRQLFRRQTRNRDSGEKRVHFSRAKVEDDPIADSAGDTLVSVDTAEGAQPAHQGMWRARYSFSFLNLKRKRCVLGRFVDFDSQGNSWLLAEELTCLTCF